MILDLEIILSGTHSVVGHLFSIILHLTLEFLANTTSSVSVCVARNTSVYVNACLLVRVRACERASQSSRQVGRLTKVKMLYSMRQEKHRKTE